VGKGFVRHRPDRQQSVASDAQVQAMNAKLSARVKEIADQALGKTEEAAQSPQAKSVAEPIYWGKGPDAWSIVSKCGRFKVRREVENPATKYLDATFRYRAFRINPEWEFELGVRSDPNDARSLCVQSLLKHPI
jgi:hypothetical protein